MKKSLEREALLSTFQDRIGYKFKNMALLEEALTHSSYANESGLSRFNERLEFLGDAVLELITSEKIYEEYPKLDEGDLTRLRSRFVCKNSLSGWAVAVKLGSIIKLGRSIIRSGATHSMEADAAEAVFGAVFLDGGYEEAKRVITSFLKMQEPYSDAVVVLDPKTELQEILQSRAMGVPYYKTVERRGPDHLLTFKVQVTLNENILATAWGNSIKEAEFKAAEAALSKI